MLENILGAIFLVIIYWQICSMFSTYSPKCLSSRLYITVSNRYIYHIFSGSFRGMRKVAVKDRNKITVLGIVDYIVLLPWVIGFIYVLWNPSADGARRLWLGYFSVVMVINLLDDLVGEAVYGIKGKYGYPL